MREIRWWIVSLGIHLLLAMLAATVTLLIGGAGDETNRVLLVTEHQPSAWVWLDERGEAHEGGMDEATKFEDGFLGVAPNVPAGFEDIVTADQLQLDRAGGSGPGEFVELFDSAQRPQPCRCPLDNIFKLCTCNEDSLEPCRCGIQNGGAAR